jgi:hypothetical protein
VAHGQRFVGAQIIWWNDLLTIILPHMILPTPPLAKIMGGKTMGKPVDRIEATVSGDWHVCTAPSSLSCPDAYFLRWRIRDRMRRFLRPIFRRPFPVFLTPTVELPELYRIDPPQPRPRLTPTADSQCRR